LHNKASGIFAASGFAGQVIVMVTNSESFNNDTGIQASGVGATVYVGQSVVTANVLGLNAANSFLNTFGDNDVIGNTTDGSFTGAPVPKK
jgi:hypothetical protein